MFSLIVAILIVVLLVKCIGLVFVPELSHGEICGSFFFAMTRKNQLALWR